MKPGEIYKSKFTVGNDDERYIVKLIEYIGNDNWKCKFDIFPVAKDATEEQFHHFVINQCLGSDITGDTLFRLYEKIN